MLTHAFVTMGPQIFKMLPWFVCWMSRFEVGYFFEKSTILFMASSAWALWISQLMILSFHKQCIQNLVNTTRWHVVSERRSWKCSNFTQDSRWPTKTVICHLSDWVVLAHYLVIKQHPVLTKILVHTKALPDLSRFNLTVADFTLPENSKSGNII